jgi:hypothetical protein
VSQQNNIVIVMEGGLIQEVRTDMAETNLNIVVADHDTEGLSDDMLTQLPTGGEVYVHVPWGGDLDMDLPDTKAIFASLETASK